MELKRCKQCGILKEADEFRPYTYARLKGTEGRLSICRHCEAINSKYKRALETLAGPVDPFRQDNARVVKAQIDNLYEVLAANGLKVPTFNIGNKAKTDAVTEDVRKLIEFYGAETKPVVAVPTEIKTGEVPDDLQAWLGNDWEEWAEKGLTPEYLQETVYEALKAKYRPQIGFDKDKLLPIHDDTYKQVLNDILRNFDDYEEWCIEQATEGQGDTDVQV